MMNGTVHQIKCGMIVHNMAKRTELKNGAVLGEGIELGEGSTVVHGPGYRIRSPSGFLRDYEKDHLPTKE